MGRFLVVAAVVVAFVPNLGFGAPVWTHSTARLSRPAVRLAAATIGDKAYFFGRASDASDDLIADIYDATTGQWSVATVSDGAANGCIASVWGSTAYIADSAGTVHVYNAADGTSSKMQLSQRRNWMATASADGMVFFAAGNYNGADFDIVDVFDTATGLWQVEHLSQKRWGAAGTSVDGKVIFAGGDEWSGPWEDAVDIYDTQTQTWLTAQLSGRSSGPAATSLAGEAYFAGGYGDGGFRTQVDIYDPLAGTWRGANLSQGRDSLTAAATDRFALFAGGWLRVGPDEYAVSDVVDVYDSLSDQWLTDNLSVARRVPAATAVGNVILVAGGSDVNGNSLDIVDLFVMEEATIPEPSSLWLLATAAFAPLVLRRLRGAPAGMTKDAGSVEEGK
jgi:hypothetical protein